MAARAKPGNAKPKRGGGKSTREQANGLDTEAVREYFDKAHNILDEMEESSATSRGELGRLYERACDKLDISKEALKLVFGEERSQRKKEAKVAKMDTRARDSMERLGASLGDSPMGVWATKMAKLAGQQTETAEA